MFPGITVTQDNYFEVFSETFIGQTQSNQFSSSAEPGKIWSSIYEDDGNGGRSTAKIFRTGTPNTVVDGVERVAGSNANVRNVPRSYYRGSISGGAFYNWYAAVAENNDYDSVGIDPEDSICPKGWSLPRGGNNPKGYNTLFMHYADIDGNPIADNPASSKKARQLPLSLELSGEFYPRSGLIGGVNLSADYFLRSRNPDYTTSRLTIGINGVNPLNGNSIANANLIRCVLR